MCTVLKFVRNAYVNKVRNGKIYDSLNFSAAREKFTKIDVTVTGNSFIFFCQFYGILKHSVFRRNLVHIASNTYNE